MITDTDTAPWYQQIWLWIVFGIPGLTVIAGIATIIIATSDIDGLVSDDYYKDGLAINQSLQRYALAKHLNIQADVHITDGRVVLSIRSASPITQPKQLQLRLTHTTRANLDQIVALSWDETDKQYAGKTQGSFGKGAWYASVETDQWRIKKRLQPPFPSQFQIP